MRKIFLLTLLCPIASLSLTSCHESLEDRAERESKEYTGKFCPTPPQNNVITDSLVFDKKTKTQAYYMRFTDAIDNAEAINAHRKEIEEALLGNVRNDPKLQAYKDAGFSFRYICRSQKDSKVVLLDYRFGPKEYNK